MNPAHYDYETLADLAEGLLEGDQAASVNAHLESCAQCRDRSAELTDVSRILAEAPVPSMPAELASRIDSAIAAESLHTATVGNLERRRGRRHWRTLSAAAATVVVLGGGGMIGKMALDAGGHEAVTPPLTDAEDQGAAAPKPSKQVAPGTAENGEFPVVRSGTDYRAGTLGEQINGMLDRKGEPRASGGRPGARLAGCVAEVTSGRAPALVDNATYGGAPATVIAAPADDQNRFDVWVVGQNCSAQDTKLREHTTIKRE